MCVSVATCAKLKEEGISWSEDTINFDKDALLQVAQNCQKAPSPHTSSSQPNLQRLTSVYWKLLTKMREDFVEEYLENLADV